jgi:hypothetical protein
VVEVSRLLLMRNASKALAEFFGSLTTAFPRVMRGPALACSRHYNFTTAERTLQFAHSTEPGPTLQLNHARFGRYHIFPLGSGTNRSVRIV